MITKVEPAHDPGPHINGHGGCFARACNGGMCPGVATAEWLNGLGDDDEPYGSGTIMRSGKVVTNGDVRRNWARSGGHHVRLAPRA